MSSHHYIQQKFQKNFFEPGKTAYWYMDTMLLVDKNGNAKNDVKYRGTRPCFECSNLYALDFIADKDYLERELFNKRIEKNYYAVDYVLAGSRDLLPSNDVAFSFIRYISAQRLRTPHGLILINKELHRFYERSTSKDTLLAFMANMMEQMGVILSEAAIEILDASDADMKFILSDVPVITYNKFIQKEGIFDFLLKGTQIIAPISRDLCIVFTPRELIDGKLSAVNFCEPRTNARITGSSIFDIRKLQNFRKVSDDEVSTINVLIREKAYRYVAGGRKEYLMCRKKLNYDTVLKPKSYRRNKEICFNRNGVLECYDEFGQKVIDGRKKKMEDFFKWTEKEK